MPASREALRDVSFPVLQAPLCRKRPEGREGPFFAASYADILAIRGFAAVEDLWPLVRGWQGLTSAIEEKLQLATLITRGSWSASRTPVAQARLTAPQTVVRSLFRCNHT